MAKNDKENKKRGDDDSAPEEQQTDTPPVPANRGITKAGDLVKVRALQPMMEERFHEKHEVFTVPAARAKALGHLVEVVKDEPES